MSDKSRLREKFVMPPAVEAEFRLAPRKCHKKLREPGSPFGEFCASNVSLLRWRGSQYHRAILYALRCDRCGLVSFDETTI